MKGKATQKGDPQPQECLAVGGGGYPATQPGPIAPVTATSRQFDAPILKQGGEPTPPSGELPRKNDGHQSEGSTMSVPDSSSEGSSGRWSCRSDTNLQWDAIRLGNRIQPYRAYALCTDDIQILSRFLELSSVADIDGDSVRLLLRGLKFLRHCDYSVEDICSILAHASAYFIDVYAVCGDRMDQNEVGNVLATLMYVAHCWVQDETCPLRVWHQHLFRRYSPLKTLNSAIMRVLEILQYILRLEDNDLSKRFAYLLAAVRWNPQHGMASRAVGSKDL